jgi:hypothetical protein
MPAKKRRADFSNVSDGGSHNPKHRPEGDYVMKIIKAEDGESKAGNDQTVFTLVVADEANKARPATYPYYCGWDDKQLWKIRKLFEAAGIPVPKKAVVVDPNKLVGKLIGAALEDDEYEGRMRSRIADTFPKDEVSDRPDDTDEDEYDEDVDDDDEPAPPKKAAKKATRRAEPEPDDDDEDEEPPRRKKAATATKKRRQPEPEDDDDEDLDLEEL